MKRSLYDGSIGPKFIEYLLDVINYLDANTEVKTFEIWISSDGGHTAAINPAIDLIRDIEKKVSLTLVNINCVAGAAVYIFAAAKNKKVYDESYFLVHRGKYTFGDDQPEMLEGYIKTGEAVERKRFGKLLQNSKLTKREKTKLRNQFRNGKDIYVNAAEAYKWGLRDV